MKLSRIPLFWILTIACSWFIVANIQPSNFIPDADAAITSTAIDIKQLQNTPVAYPQAITIYKDAISTVYYVNQTERYCLAEAIYHEARGESLVGKLAVALVVMNRVSRSDFPNTICGVVHDAQLSRKGIPIRNKCQFSYYCDGISDDPKDKQTLAASLDLAQSVLDGKVIDFTAGATHYHTIAVSTNWGYPKVAQIDNHIFYKRK